MKLITPRSVWASLIGVAWLAALLCCGSEAQARGAGGFSGGGSRGGGFHGGGGLSGGSFREGGGWGEGPRGGRVVITPQAGVYGRTPRGGEFYRGPFGGEAVRGPHGGEAVRGPHGGEVVPGIRGRTVYRAPGYYGGAHMVTAPGNWGPYLGPAYGPGPAAALTTGMVVLALPPAAVARTVGGKRYFFDGSTYYLPCYQGSDLAYCVVPDPNQ